MSAIVFTLVMASACGILVQGSSTSFVGSTAETGKSAAVGLYVTSFYIGGTFGGWLKSSTHFLRVQRYVTGTVYIGLGVVTALAGSNKK